MFPHALPHRRPRPRPRPLGGGGLHLTERPPAVTKPSPPPLLLLTFSAVLRFFFACNRHHDAPPERFFSFLFIPMCAGWGISVPRRSRRESPPSALRLRCAWTHITHIARYECEEAQTRRESGAGSTGTCWTGRARVGLHWIGWNGRYGTLGRAGTKMTQPLTARAVGSDIVPSARLIQVSLRRRLRPRVRVRLYLDIVPDASHHRRPLPPHLLGDVGVRAEHPLVVRRSRFDRHPHSALKIFVWHQPAKYAPPEDFSGVLPCVMRHPRSRPVTTYCSEAQYSDTSLQGPPSLQATHASLRPTQPGRPSRYSILMWRLHGLVSRGTSYHSVSEQVPLPPRLLLRRSLDFRGVEVA
ncbi:hypothetical protein MSAN_02419400 [Mycena sanguinolenta]|uniref:Uncharacterized protein n=1 Tax=Mycena sanguinolenta TaxID=230812 RepID=A0A8H6X3J9_9AGAR|nr:hypothetical protein MSAN_02419400 [Mycena sanguinolenta]